MLSKDRVVNVRSENAKHESSFLGIFEYKTRIHNGQKLETTQMIVCRTVGGQLWRVTQWAGIHSSMVEHQNILLSEISQTQKHTFHVTPFI